MRPFGISRLNVKDEAIRNELMIYASNQRSWISGILENKRTVAERKSRQFDKTVKIVGITLGVLGLLVTFIKLLKG